MTDERPCKKQKKNIVAKLPCEVWYQIATYLFPRDFKCGLYQANRELHDLPYDMTLTYLDGPYGVLAVSPIVVDLEKIDLTHAGALKLRAEGEDIIKSMNLLCQLERIHSITMVDFECMTTKYEIGVNLSVFIRLRVAILNGVNIIHPYGCGPLLHLETLYLANYRHNGLDLRHDCPNINCVTIEEKFGVDEEELPTYGSNTTYSNCDCDPNMCFHENMVVWEAE
jgi:hypothetical protein